MHSFKKSHPKWLQVQKEYIITAWFTECVVFRYKIKPTPHPPKQDHFLLVALSYSFPQFLLSPQMKVTIKSGLDCSLGRQLLTFV